MKIQKKKNTLTTKELIEAESRYEEKSLDATLKGNAKLAKWFSERARAINLVVELHRTGQL